MSSGALVGTTALRARFAAALSSLYAGEVPAYGTLVEVAGAVNAAVMAGDPATAQRLGSIERVTAERHGAIRVGTARELGQVGQVFAALGMHPVGFYDLREAGQPVPVVSTAFRPVEEEELAANPFRVFTSVLATDDRRFFDADLQERLEARLAQRELFSPQLLALAARAEADGGLGSEDADVLVRLATAAFALSPEPVDAAWYAELERVSGVAADIGGVGSTHVNHLTPRVLDIDALYARMTERGVTMIDAIQGPPGGGDPVLLRQTSFRALAEPRAMRDPDGSVREGALRVRFGEVEARGCALTPAGRARYDAWMAAGGTPQEREAHWRNLFPADADAQAAAGLTSVRWVPVADRPADGRTPVGDLARLLADGWVRAEPVVYEDFLPASAAGIFASNLDRRDDEPGGRRGDGGASHRDLAWLAEALGRDVLDPVDLYAATSRASADGVARALDLPPLDLPVADAAASGRGGVLEHA
ncbi:2-oxoadipate dioxygenase/decarboxylase [Pseudokineococcus sp. 1T1Z-3]|uniref:2-oxoadipate dioxygenase/decarboxylase n=1 Tax=Pseudokineococcus sp. 1T1Z-3 TaxID=3132745 RepID=UPI0030B2AE1B